MAGQLAALARLGALRHLDLQLVGVRKVLRRDAEAAARDLLDRRAAAVAEARRVLAALARVRAPSQRVHSQGERLVRLGRDRPERHGSSACNDISHHEAPINEPMRHSAAAVRSRRVQKRLTISDTASTSSIGTAGTSSRKLSSPRIVTARDAAAASRT